MRQVGTLPRTIDPRIFGDYLESIGIGHRFVPSHETWVVWILNEDQIGKAKVELDAYLLQQDDPKYHLAKTTAEEVRREAARKDRLYARNVRHVGAQWSGPNFRRKPLTSLLIGVCVALFFVGRGHAAGSWIDRNFLFFTIEPLNSTDDVGRGLKAILSGQVWRLWTPALLHANLVHLILNMLALNSVGSLIETRKGTAFLAILVVVSAAVSNIGQYLYIVNFEDHLIRWVGISGVVFALFGYVWMKGRIQPEEGMVLPPTSVQLLLLWLVLGFAVPSLHFANGAHAVGLAVGVLMGLARL